MEIDGQVQEMHTDRQGVVLPKADDLGIGETARWKFSQYGYFAVNKGVRLRHYLFCILEIRDNFVVTRDPTMDREILGKPYYAHIYAHMSQFINDCLQFVEGLVIGEPSYRGERSMLRPLGSRIPFGQSDGRNMQVANMKRVIQNEHANPNIGEAYAIVRTGDLWDDVVPYHIAYVLAKDGNSNITIEADAGTKLRKPVFDIYSVISDSGETFHDRYKAELYNTIVLREIE